MITAQLVDAQTDTHLWSDTYQRELEDIFAIQREIATAIADQLQITLSGSQEETLVPMGTDTPEAHEAYLRGRHFLSQRTRESIRSAVPEFERAIELDPDYAEAYSGLADSYVLLDIYAIVPDPRVVRERALEVALQAVLLAPDLGMAHASLAGAYNKLGQWENAEREFERAIQLNPGYATAHQWYGGFLVITGRADEAVDVARRAVGIDPVAQIVSRDLGLALWAAGRLDEAIEQWRRTIQLDPTWPRAWEDLSTLLVDAGEYDEALQAYMNWARLSDADSVQAREFLDSIIRYKETGEAQSFSLPNDYPGVSAFQVFPYSATGQREAALAGLERLLEERDYWGIADTHYPGVWGTDDLLGDDPRYQALLAEAGITW